jgi:multicomponent Na+:H+ antiporter subunit C
MPSLANYMYYVGAGGLILIGLYMVLAKTNLIKVILGLSFLDTGIHVLLVAIGYVRGRTAPVLSKTMSEGAPVVDPVPQALVLTAIVIGVGVIALALALAIRVYAHYGTLDVREIKGLRW